MNNVNPTTKFTKTGNYYDIPKGIDADVFYNVMYEIIDLVTNKGLTIRQAQYLFRTCEDYVLENKLS